MSNEISFDEILKLNRHYRKNSDFKSPEINYRYGNELANKNQSFFKNGLDKKSTVSDVGPLCNSEKTIPNNRKILFDDADI